MELRNYLLIILCTAAVYIIVFIVLRLSGKKELSQLTIFEFVFVLLISEAVQNSMLLGKDDFASGIVALVTLFLLNYLFERQTFYNTKFFRLVEGNPVILLYKGKILHRHLRENRIRVEELEAAIRENGCLHEDEVEQAVLETDGHISIIPKNRK